MFSVLLFSGQAEFETGLFVAFVASGISSLRQSGVLSTCKFNSNFLDQVAKFQLIFDKFCCHFSGIN